MKNTPMKLLFGLLVVVALSFGQTTMTSTTLSALQLGQTATGPQTVSVASASGITAPGSLGQTTTILMIDMEEERVTSVNGTIIGVQRGSDGTKVSSHASGATVWVGPPGAFSQVEPAGACGGTGVPAPLYLPVVVTTTGRTFQCPSTGPNANLWVVATIPVGYQSTDGWFFVPASNCGSTLTTTAYTSGYPVFHPVATGESVLEIGTTSTGGAVELTCAVSVPSRLTAGKGVALTAVSLLYGEQTTALSSIATATFKSITFPTSTAGGAAAAGTVAQAGGTLTVTPTSLQTATTTSGLCYNEKMTFATPIGVTTDNTEYALDQVFTTAGSTASITQVCGVIVYYSNDPI